MIARALGCAPGIAPGAANHATEFLVIARDMEHAFECADDGAELYVDLALGAAGSRRVRQSGAGHASRDLIGSAKKRQTSSRGRGRERSGSNSTPSDSTAIQASPDILLTRIGAPTVKPESFVSRCLA